MTAEVPQVPQAMDGPHGRGEEAADALARELVATLATPLERIGCDDNAHRDVAVEGAEGDDAQAQERGPDVPRSSCSFSSSSSSSCFLSCWVRQLLQYEHQWLRHEQVISALSEIAYPNDVIIPVM